MMTVLKDGSSLDERNSITRLSFQSNYILRLRMEKNITSKDAPFLKLSLGKEYTVMYTKVTFNYSLVNKRIYLMVRVLIYET